MSDSLPPARTAGVLRRMVSRDPDEAHRVSTPLELLFDLCFVVAVAQCGARLVPHLAEGHVGEGIVAYLFTFFGVWWAWMNFTWFASAYDTDDVPYRLLVLLQMAGAQVYAAGVPRAADHNDWTIAVIGYVIMRLAQTTQWLRAARSETGAPRTTAVTYAIGLIVCQCGWVALLFAPDDAKRWLFLVLVALELAVPAVAERRSFTAWHPHHIAERYGLFTIIVIGETISAGTQAMQSALGVHHPVGHLLMIAIGGLLVVFSAWWIYFASSVHDIFGTLRTALTWGYGHYVIFGSMAAVGAGLEVAVEQAVGAAEISATAAAAAVTVPSAIFMFTVWLLHARHHKRGLAENLLLPLAALAVLACTFAGEAAVLAAGLVCAADVALGLTVSARRAAAE